MYACRQADRAWTLCRSGGSVACPLCAVFHNAQMSNRHLLDTNECVVLQGVTDWRQALAVSPGLDVAAFQDLSIVPSPVCANTTSAHYACTVSHLFMLLQAYQSEQVHP